RRACARAWLESCACLPCVCCWISRSTSAIIIFLPLTVAATVLAGPASLPEPQAASSMAPIITAISVKNCICRVCTLVFLLLIRCEEVFRVPTSVGSFVNLTESPTEVGTLSTCIRSFLDRPSFRLLWFAFQRPPPIHTVVSRVNRQERISNHG